MRAPGHPSVEDNANISISVDLIAVSRAKDRSGEGRYTSCAALAFWLIEHLIDYHIDGLVSFMARRRKPLRERVYWIIELAKIVPAAKFDRAGRAAAVAVGIVGLEEQQGGIVKAKIEAVRVTLPGITFLGAGTGWITIINPKFQLE
ncbi:hypothetical protein GL4_1249 [Methyloceanibacter caenitepidi]|uniref:Uncharacterized protein n=1 Tax=Methyloceanibacter caenitepidi TaxID=1384459 RepID=A0A0A8K2G0_9HYPH|nr:hypothetical protein GL4_1249 [Methyloceanibacter caenitepidi]